MDALVLLEKRIADLISYTKQLKIENDALKVKIAALEESVLKGSEKSVQEKELTDLVMSELLESIDSLIQNEQPS